MNQDSFASSGFARLFTWMAKAKFTMGIFFSMYVVVYLFFGLFVEDSISLDFFTAVEMLFASFAIGLFQQIMIPTGMFNRSRCFLWIISGVFTTIIFGVAFRWFASFPKWCFPLFICFLVIGMLFMILSYYLELYKETKQLNLKLEQFRKTKQEREV